MSCCWECFFREICVLDLTKPAQQRVHRLAGGHRVLSLAQTRNLVPFRKLVLPAAGNANRWAVHHNFMVTMYA